MKIIPNVFFFLNLFCIPFSALARQPQRRNYISLSRFLKEDQPGLKGNLVCLKSQSWSRAGVIEGSANKNFSQCDLIMFPVRDLNLKNSAYQKSFVFQQLHKRHDYS